MTAKQAAFVAVRLSDGRMAATTRAADSWGKSKIGLPGGKCDPGETLVETALREACEEGWAVEQIDAEPFHTAQIGEWTCHWFRARSAVKLDDYLEKGRITPVEVSIMDLMSPDLGNDIAMETLLGMEAGDAICEDMDRLATGR